MGNLKVIIQCASRKADKAGTLHWRGIPVRFVAEPGTAPSGDWLNAKPDDPVPNAAKSWRQTLVEYNAAGGNPNGLIQAGKLYRHPAYGKLVYRYGLGNLYILSAGWGLVRGTYLLPDYDITFSTVKPMDKWKQRRCADVYADFNHLAEDGVKDTTIYFVGSKPYMPLLERLTVRLSCPKVAFFRVPPGFTPEGNNLTDAHGAFTMIPFPTARSTNWHYDAAAALANHQV